MDDLFPKVNPNLPKNQLGLSNLTSLGGMMNGVSGMSSGLAGMSTGLLGGVAGLSSGLVGNLSGGHLNFSLTKHVDLKDKEVCDLLVNKDYFESILKVRDKYDENTKSIELLRNGTLQRVHFYDK